MLASYALDHFAIRQGCRALIQRRLGRALRVVILASLALCVLEGCSDASFVRGGSEHGTGNVEGPAPDGASPPDQHYDSYRWLART